MKKPVVIVLGAVVLGAIGAGTYLLVNPSFSSSQSPVVGSEVPAVTETPAKRIFWKDPAGFTFSYPEGVVINKHDEDKVNYAHIEMTDPKHQGSLILWAKDLPPGVTDAATWVKKDAALAGSNTLDTTLGTIAAKKILITQPEKKIVIGTVADGLLFYIESVLTDETYWQRVVNTVTETFAITPTDTQVRASPGEAAVDDVVADEEEVLE